MDGGEQLMFCVYCGQQVSDGARFCSRCGKPRFPRSNETPSNTPSGTRENLSPPPIGSSAQDNPYSNYQPAPTSLLKPVFSNQDNEQVERELRTLAHKIEDVIKENGIYVEVTNILPGPSWTRFELYLEPGTRISQILYLKKDLKLRLAVEDLEIVAPIPGKSVIGIDIKNDHASYNGIRALVEETSFKRASETTLVLGTDQNGNPIFCDLAKIQHLLITGYDTKYVSLIRNSLLCSVLCKAKPDSLRMIIIDTKVTDLQMLNGIPHLEMPVVTNSENILKTLQWINNEMQRRFSLLNDVSRKNIKEYNEQPRFNSAPKLPHIMVLINTTDDWDFSTINNDHLFSSILSKSEIVGIHIVACTRTNTRTNIFHCLNQSITSKVVFAVSSKETSKVIIGVPGAELLHVDGDLYYLQNDMPRAIRGTCAMASSEELENITEYLKKHYGSCYSETYFTETTTNVVVSNNDGLYAKSDDELFEQAVEVVLENCSASLSVLQRKLGIGYPQAARLVDKLEKRNIIGPFEGPKPRRILITETEWLEMKNNRKDY